MLDFFLICLTFSKNSFSQKIKGTVINLKEEAVPFVLILQNGKAIAISDGNGNYEISPKNGETYNFKAMGYELKTLKGYDLIESPKVILAEQAILLDSLLVRQQVIF